MNKTEQWISWLTKGTKTQWKEATLSLGGLNENSDVDIDSLVQAIHTENKDILFWCIGALGALRARSKPALKRIMELTNHPYLAVRQSSIMALAKIAPDESHINEILIEKLEDKDQFVRCHVLSAFIEMDKVGPKEIAAIKSRLTDESKFVAQKAEVALRNIKFKENTPNRIAIHKNQDY